MLMKTLLWLKAPPAPSGPQRRSCKASGPVTMAMTTSAALARALGWEARPAPCFTRGAAFSGLRL